MYNANPTSVNTAIDSLSKIEHDHKLVIVGDMLELGEYSAQKHQNVIEQLKELNIPFITVGAEFKKVHSGESSFDTTEELISSIKANPLKGRYILLKGSRGIKLEQLLEVL